MGAIAIRAQNAVAVVDGTRRAPSCGHIDGHKRQESENVNFP